MYKLQEMLQYSEWLNNRDMTKDFTFFFKNTACDKLLLSIQLFIIIMPIIIIITIAKK